MILFFCGCAGTNAPTTPHTCLSHVPWCAESLAPQAQKAGRQRGGTCTLTQLHIKLPTHSGRRHHTSRQPCKSCCLVQGRHLISCCRLWREGGHPVREVSPSVPVITAQPALQSCSLPVDAEGLEERSCSTPTFQRADWRVLNDACYPKIHSPRSPQSVQRGSS